MAELVLAAAEPALNSQNPTVDADLAGSSDAPAPKPYQGFTSENAAAMALRAQAVRREKQAKLKAANQVPPPLDDSYVQRRLYRTRLQIDAVCDRIDQEDDAAELTRLTQALERLQDIESDLSSRPVRPRIKDCGSNAVLSPVRTYANLPPEKRKKTKAPVVQPGPPPAPQSDVKP